MKLSGAKSDFGSDSVHGLCVVQAANRNNLSVANKGSAGADTTPSAQSPIAGAKDKEKAASEAPPPAMNHVNQDAEERRGAADLGALQQHIPQQNNVEEMETQEGTFHSV